MHLYLSVILLCAFISVNNAIPTEEEVETRIRGMNLTNTEELTSYITELFLPYRDHIRMLIKESMSTRRPKPRADFVTCDVCKPAVPLLRTLLALGIPQELIIRTIVDFCLREDLAPAPELCDPTIRSYAEPTLYILRNRPELKMADFCGILNPGCTEVDPTFTDWIVIIDTNKPPAEDQTPLPDVEKTKILQITDVHLDLDYVEGMSARCDYPTCCREEQGPGEGDDAAGRFGHFSCELPKAGLDAIYAHAKEIHSDTKYIFLTGDYIHSNVWLYGEAENSRHITAVTTALREAFPDTPIYPVTGNHEPNVVNMYPPYEIWSEFDLEWMYSATSDAFTEYFPDDQLALFKRGGYYTVKPDDNEKLRLIVLNTNLCYINNFWLAFDSIDPEDQLQWFSNTLLEAENAGEIIYIIGHIQPGSGSCWPVWSAKFDAIINRFEGIIKAQFYGHSHTEYFTLAFEKGTDRAISTSYIAPSTVTDGMHAGYKVYFADGKRGEDSTWEIVDHESWILNITESNAAGEPKLNRVYNAREDYGLTSFRPEALKAFVYKMATDDALLGKFIWNLNKGDGPRYRPCNGKGCKIDYLCELVTSNSADKTQCDKIREYIDPSPTTTIEPPTTTNEPPTTTNEPPTTTNEPPTTTNEPPTTTNEPPTTTTNEPTTTTTNEPPTTTNEPPTTTTNEPTTTTTNEPPTTTTNVPPTTTTNEPPTTTTNEPPTTTTNVPPTTTTNEPPTTTTNVPPTTTSEGPTTTNEPPTTTNPLTTTAAGSKNFVFGGLSFYSIFAVYYIFKC